MKITTTIEMTAAELKSIKSATKRSLSYFNRSTSGKLNKAIGSVQKKYLKIHDSEINLDIKVVTSVSNMLYMLKLKDTVTVEINYNINESVVIDTMDLLKELSKTAAPIVGALSMLSNTAVSPELKEKWAKVANVDTSVKDVSVNKSIAPVPRED